MRINTNGDLERVTLADVHLHMYAASPQTRNCFVRLFSFVDVRIADMHLSFCYLLLLLVSIFRIYIIHLHTFHMYSIHSMAAPVLAGSFGRAHSRPKRPKFGSRVRISRARSGLFACVLGVCTGARVGALLLLLCGPPGLDAAAASPMEAN